MAYVTLTFAKNVKTHRSAVDFSVPICRWPRTFIFGRMEDVRLLSQSLLFVRPWPIFANVTHI